jgi:hypothetical protein
MSARTKRKNLQKKAPPLPGPLPRCAAEREPEASGLRKVSTEQQESLPYVGVATFSKPAFRDIIKMHP